MTKFSDPGISSALVVRAGRCVNTAQRRVSLLFRAMARSMHGVPGPGNLRVRFDRLDSGTITLAG